jgi:hypothetical protein
MSDRIITEEFVRREWHLTTRDRRKHEVALCWMHHVSELHLLSKDNIYHEFSRFREDIRSGRLKCSEANLKERQDQDGPTWHFLVVQDKAHLIAMEPIASALEANGGGVAPLGTDPIALFEFHFLVCGFVYFFKKKKNRDALFKFLNDMPDHAPPSAISQGCKVIIQGLVSKPELNGCRGRVVGCYNEERQRWPVRVMPKTGAHEDMLLKVANIMLASAVLAAAVPASAAAAAASITTTTAASDTTTSGGGAIDRIPDPTQHGDYAHPPPP